MLHKSKLNEFREWLESIGWEREEEKSCYEALRMRHSDQGVLLVYEKDDSIEHYTTHGIGYRLVHTWLRERKS